MLALEDALLSLEKLDPRQVFALQVGMCGAEFMDDFRLFVLGVMAKQPLRYDLVLT